MGRRANFQIFPHQFQFTNIIFPDSNLVYLQNHDQRTKQEERLKKQAKDAEKKEAERLKKQAKDAEEMGAKRLRDILGPTAETETVATVSAASTAPVPATAPVPIAHAAPVPAEQTTAAETETEDVADLPELKPRGVESNPGTTDVTTWTSEALMSFLGDHWDTHALPTTFFSLSSQDSFVYYKKDKEVVAQLLIPARFSIVVTTEIHSGLKSLNPHKLKHCSESSDDRLLFRIVHELPRESTWIEPVKTGLNLQPMQSSKFSSNEPNYDVRIRYCLLHSDISFILV